MANIGNVTQTHLGELLAFLGHFHGKFIEKYDLPFSLIADTDKEVINAFGCWGPKKFMGREYEGILRKTFVIENDTILKAFEKVKTTAHFEQIMEALN